MSFYKLTLIGFHLSFFTLVWGEEEILKSVKAEDAYKLKPDEFWPDEVAHLFENGQEEVKKAAPPSPKNKKHRNRRWTEWVSEKHEFREDSWDEADKKIRNKQKDEPKFIAYQKNGTFIMSRCSSPKGALTLVIACPQPRGSKFQRIVNLKHAVYGWSQAPDVCQYIDGDCTKRYEFVHKAIMKPTTPQWFEEWKSLGPEFFCNPWEGNGRKEWQFPQKRWCSVGLRRSSQSPNPEDMENDNSDNKWGLKYLYTWSSCGSPYDWFDYLHIEYTCERIEGSPNPDATVPYHYRNNVPGYKPDCPDLNEKVKKTTIKTPIEPMPNETSLPTMTTYRNITETSDHPFPTIVDQNVTEAINNSNPSPSTIVDQNVTEANNPSPSTTTYRNVTETSDSSLPTTSTKNITEASNPLPSTTTHQNVTKNNNNLPSTSPPQNVTGNVTKTNNLE